MRTERATIEGCADLSLICTTEQSKKVKELLWEHLAGKAPVKAGSVTACYAAVHLACTAGQIYDGEGDIVTAAIVAAAGMTAKGGVTEVLCKLAQNGVTLPEEAMRAAYAAGINWQHGKSALLADNHMAIAMYVAAWYLHLQMLNTTVDTAGLYPPCEGSEKDKLLENIKRCLPLVSDPTPFRRLANRLLKEPGYMAFDAARANRRVAIAIRLAKPENEKETAEVVFAALCTDLWKMGCERDAYGGAICDDGIPVGALSAIRAAMLFGAAASEEVLEAIRNFQGDALAENGLADTFRINSMALAIHAASVITEFEPQEEPIINNAAESGEKN